MTGAPSFCEHCELVFESPKIQIRDSYNVSFIDYKVKCPKCGGQAKVVKGTFDFVDGGIRVVSADSASIERIRLLRLLIDEAKSGVDPDKILSKLEEVSPGLAREGQDAIRNGGIPALILMLLFLAHGCTTSNNSRIDLNQLVDQWHVYTTGEPAYPFSAQTSSLESSSEQEPELNRQQRRQQEYQSRKRQLQPGPLPSSEPKPPSSASPKRGKGARKS